VQEVFTLHPLHRVVAQRSPGLSRHGPVSRGRQGLRDRWRLEVYRSGRIGDACRVLLIYLADNMTDSGSVSIPREVIAKALEVHPRRVTDRITEAVRAGLLQKAGGGWKGMTAQYVAVLPAKVALERPPFASIGGGFPSTYKRPPLETANPTEQPPKVAAEAVPIAHVTNATTNQTPKSAPTSRPETSGSVVSPSVPLLLGNPPCRVCGELKLYSPSTIARGVCAACVLLDVS
jgi:hypothetical protein